MGPNQALWIGSIDALWIGSIDGMRDRQCLIITRQEDGSLHEELLNCPNGLGSHSFTVCYTEGRVWVISSQKNTDNTQVSTVYYMSVDTQEWTQVERRVAREEEGEGEGEGKGVWPDDMVWSKCTAIGHKVLVYGSSPYEDELWVYDTHTNTWSDSCDVDDLCEEDDIELGGRGTAGGAAYLTNYTLRDPITPGRTHLTEASLYKYRPGGTPTLISRLPCESGMPGAPVVIGHNVLIPTVVRTVDNSSFPTDMWLYSEVSGEWTCLDRLEDQSVLCECLIGDSTVLMLYPTYPSPKDAEPASKVWVAEISLEEEE
ncbi:hypothetical protein KIPB_006808 [Kipferlia bialata]|uniref:Uncharacterized protein n=1 Tax=Kipferlia bialata TaxID=797122 RepID=A0A9K3CZE0_9EUKA|nr:hypothetical protein KIPB_006808 [Kipferlia bialata]|eukprot:g6808.t1